MEEHRAKLQREIQKVWQFNCRALQSYENALRQAVKDIDDGNYIVLDIPAPMCASFPFPSPETILEQNGYILID